MKKSQIYLTRLKVNLWMKQQNESFIIISFLSWSLHSTFLAIRFKIIPCKIICHPLNNKHKEKIKLIFYYYLKKNLYSLKLKFLMFFSFHKELMTYSLNMSSKCNPWCHRMFKHFWKEKWIQGYNESPCAK